jgi:hypothetical protein
MSAELFHSGSFDLLFFTDIKTVSAFQSHLILQHAVNITKCLSNTLTIDVSRGCILKVSQTTVDSNVLRTSVRTSENSLSQLYRPSRRQLKKVRTAAREVPIDFVRFHVDQNVKPLVTPTDAQHYNLCILSITELLHVSAFSPSLVAYTMI